MEIKNLRQNESQSMDRELYEYKQKVVSLLSKNKEITEALNPHCELNELVYEYIFPFEKVPDIQMSARCIISISVDMPNVSTKNFFFKDVLLKVSVVCHENLMRVENYGMPRTDFISAKICELLNGNTDFGYGELQLVSNIEAPFSERHYIRAMRFVSKEQAKTNLCR